MGRSAKASSICKTCRMYSTAIAQPLLFVKRDVKLPEPTQANVSRLQLMQLPVPMPDCIGVQVYMLPNQLAYCLRDPEILEMVHTAQLKLVLMNSIPELFTFCVRVNGSISADKRAIHAACSISADEKGVNFAGGSIDSSIALGDEVGSCPLLLQHSVSTPEVHLIGRTLPLGALWTRSQSCRIED